MAEKRDVLRAAVLAGDAADHIHARLDAGGEAGEIERLAAVETEGLAGRAILELQRQHAHADEVGAVNALEALGDDGLHAQQQRALRRPVAR